MISAQMATTFLLALLFLPCSVSAQAYPLRTIEEVQFVLNPQISDQSLLLGDTIEVRGLVMTDVRSQAVDPGWGCFVVDPNFPSDPWQGLFIIQSDTSATATAFGDLLPGDVCRFTGIVAESGGFTRLQVLTNPLVAVVLENFGVPLPLPIELTTTDLGSPQDGEQWEAQLVRIDSTVIINNAVPGNRATIQDESILPAFLDDNFAFFRSRFDNGNYSWPATGSSVDVRGFVRGLTDGYSVNPGSFADLIILTSPPAIADVVRDPLIPTTLDSAIVTSTITDNGSVIAAFLHYSSNFGPWIVTGMIANGNIWRGVIPPDVEGSFLRYFVSAEDNDGLAAQFPADTSMTSGNTFRYVVRDNGPLIADVQNTYGYQRDESGYEGFTFTLEGAVMSAPNQFIGYFIQEAADAWSGIFAVGNLGGYSIGDWISVTGRIEENFGMTRIAVTSSMLLVPGFGAFDPAPQSTGNLATGGPLAEAYESVLVSLNNVTVTDIMPDGQNNFGEFIIDDGSGGMRVDDESEVYDGNLTEMIELGSSGSLRGLLIYQFSEFKLEPRDSNDVNLALVGIEADAALPTGFELQQNYPNPFNPSTTIGYTLPQDAEVRLVVYDLLGREVAVLVTGHQPAGSHTVQWDGRNASDSRVGSGIYIYRLESVGQSRQHKMLLLK